MKRAMTASEVTLKTNTDTLTDDGTAAGGRGGGKESWQTREQITQLAPQIA